MEYDIIYNTNEYIYIYIYIYNIHSLNHVYISNTIQIMDTNGPLNNS